MDNDHYELPNSFQILMKQIGRRPLLTVEQELELARAMQTGDIKAFHELVEANIGLAISMANYYRWSGLTYEDLIQEAICGLMTGIRKFDPDRGTRLSTYTFFWIKQAILRALGHTHRDEKFSFFDDSLEPEKEPLLDTIPDDRPTPEQAIIQLATTEAVHLALDCLPSRDQEIIKLRYGINKERSHTRDEIGHLMKLTRKQVKQIEARVLRKLRRPLKGIKHNR